MLEMLHYYLLLLFVFFWVFLRTSHKYEVVNELERKSDTSANYYFDEEGYEQFEQYMKNLDRSLGL